VATIPVDFFLPGRSCLFILRIWLVFMERVALASPGVDGVARDSGLSDPRLCNTLILKRWVINKNHVKGFLMK
jgi:hypothetical protein